MTPVRFAVVDNGAVSSFDPASEAAIARLTGQTPYSLVEWLVRRSMAGELPVSPIDNDCWQWAVTLHRRAKERRRPLAVFADPTTPACPACRLFLDAFEHFEPVGWHAGTDCPWCASPRRGSVR